jgi:hypothetical protein
MSANRDIDGITRAWLELMPDEAPDRVIDAVLQAVDTEPQVRRPWPTGPMRSIRMNRFLLIAATAIVAVGLLGGAAFITGGRQDSQPSSAPLATPIASNVANGTAAPTSSASSSAPASSSVPASLAFTWAGQPRTLPGGAPLTQPTLQFDQFGACLGASALGTDCAMSRLDDASGGTLRFSTTTGNQCAVGDTGTYPWSLSPRGTVLTIGQGTDDCVVRAAGFPGTWYRVACAHAASNCLGDLEAGTYPSQYITPRLDPTAPWQPDFGAVTYTVPDGWANAVDFPMELELTPSSSYARWTPTGAPDGVTHAIDILADPSATIQDKACSFAVDASIDRSADGLAAWLKGLPSLRVSNVHSTTIDGHHAQQLDLAVNASRASICPGDTVKSAVVFTPARQDTGNVPHSGMCAGERDRVFLVDLGERHTAAVIIDDADCFGRPDDPARFQAFVDQAQPIVQSLHFR